MEEYVCLACEERGIPRDQIILQYKGYNQISFGQEVHCAPIYQCPNPECAGYYMSKARPKVLEAYQPGAISHKIEIAPTAQQKISGLEKDIKSLRSQINKLKKEMKEWQER